MIIGIPKEIRAREKRVALSPELVDSYKKLGFTVCVEHGAGELASFHDADYEKVGAQLLNREELWRKADVIMKVRSPSFDSDLSKHEADLLKEGALLICLLGDGRTDAELMNRLKKNKNNLIALESIPRISRAQKMDVLSSMANIAGYRAVIEAATHFGSFFTGQMTAAGKIPPAKVLVIGAGVAGLAAIGTAKGLGAVVRAFDIRKEVADQIKSMGAQFLTVELDEDGSGGGGYAKTMSPEFIKAEMDLFKNQAKEVDIIITTALIPGKKAPILIDDEILSVMKEGSVIVDMAAEQGGNCSQTVQDEAVTKNGVTIIGFTDLPSRLAKQASRLLAKNLYHLITEIQKDAGINLDLNNEVVLKSLILHHGEPVVIPESAKQQPAAPKPASAAQQLATQDNAKKAKWYAPLFKFIGLAAVIALAAMMILYTPQPFFGHLTVFILACFVGYQVIWNVKPALHTPLMSVTNAISGIIILGALIPLSGNLNFMVSGLAGIAVLLAAINIVGGFFVTQKMLRMFKK